MVLGLLIGAAALGGGFVATRNFVRRRLRFVDAVRNPAAPLVAGIAGGLAASVVALPLGVLLPVGVWTAAASGRPATLRSARTASFANVLPDPFSTSSRAVHFGNAGRTGVAICNVSNASATARIFTVNGSGSASMSQSSPTIS